MNIPSHPTRKRSRNRSVGLVAAALAVLAVLVVGVSLASGAAPTVTIENASAVGYTTAVAKGTVDPSTAETFYHFEYATEASFANAESAGFGFLPEGAGSTPVEVELQGLTPGTTYHLRLVAENAESGGVPSEAVAPSTFTTKVAPAPVVTIVDASEVHARDAKAEGTVEITENDPALNASCVFQYGTASDFSNAQSTACEPNPVLASEPQPVAVTASLTGLKAGTTYHLRLQASNIGGSDEAVAPSTFTTPAAEPTVDSTFADEVTTTGATLNAEINPSGAPTTYSFEYGPTSAYGFTVAGSAALPAVDADELASVEISGLNPHTVYHYRVVATNAVETVSGPDKTFTTFAESGAPASCPNAAFRDGPSAALPDCRAYEQASPVDKSGSDVSGEPRIVRAATSGDAVTFGTKSPLSVGVGARDYPVYISRRTPTGWSTGSILPPSAAGEFIRIAGLPSSLSETFTTVASNFTPQGKGPALLSRDTTDGAYETIHSYTSGTPTQRSMVIAATGNGNEVFFEDVGPALAPGAAAGKQNLYVWDRDTGAIKTVSALPGIDCETGACAPPEGVAAGPYPWRNTVRGGMYGFFTVEDQHAVSDGGDAVFFTDLETKQIYARINPAGAAPVTLPVSESQRSPVDPGGTQPAQFWAATPSGSKVFFTSCEKLTDDSTAHSTEPGTCENYEAGQGEDLYVYEKGSHALNDLTVDPTDPEGADVMGVLGASEDGNYVYFVANGDLDGAGPAELGDCRSEGPENNQGTCNLYLWHDGAVTFVSKLDITEDWLNWLHKSSNGTPEETSRVSADGQVLLFSSTRSLTGYENEGSREFFRYQVGASGPTCVSCNPSGAPPVGGSNNNFFPDLRDRRMFNAFGEGWKTDSVFQTRNLSSDGTRVFFESMDRLLPADTDGLHGCVEGSCRDVYEWEQIGSGSCREEAVEGGCLYLVSSGKGPEPSFLADVSATGDDVFFFTSDRLVPQDGDELADVYDARVGGGIASQHQVPQPPCEPSGGSCAGPGTNAGAQQTAGTASFSGPSNPPAERHKKRRSRHHHRRHHHGKHHHRKHGGRHVTHSGNDRGAGE